VRKLTIVATLLFSAACASKKENAVPISTAAVQRRDIVIDAQATGVVEPIFVVEVKSKAGGQIVKLPVETGTIVKPGDLLVQIETRDVQNQYDQVAAQLAAAKSKLDVSTAQKKRADDLFKSRIITATEHEAAQIDFANAQSALVAARTSLDLRKQSLEDATVTAPVGRHDHRAHRRTRHGHHVGDWRLRRGYDSSEDGGPEPGARPCAVQ
jgi:HlyD family secretion protein